MIATGAALDAIGRLRHELGPLVLFQSGGCCDGSIPLCFREGQLIVSPADVLLGDVGGIPFYIDPRQFEVVRGCQLVLDIAPGDPEGFSLPAGENAHFVVTSRMFSEEEMRALEHQGSR